MHNWYVIVQDVDEWTCLRLDQIYHELFELYRNILHTQSIIQYYYFIRKVLSRMLEVIY